MKILLVGPRFHTNQYQMVKTLQEHNHEITFHVASLGATEDYSLLTPIKYRQSSISKIVEKIAGKGGVNRPNYFPGIFLYWKVLKKLKPDIIVIRDPYRFFSMLAATYAALLGAKIIFYTQENLFRNRNLKTRIRQKLIINFFGAAWMVPIKGKESDQTGKLKHMFYIPLPIPIDNISRNHKDDGDTKILMIGKYNQERKNHLLLVNAVSNLSKLYHFKVTIVGECTREQQVARFEKIKETVCMLGLDDIIDMKRNVPFKEIGNLYRSHHVFVLPAIDEQYGVSVTEALGYGMPAICTDTCGARFNITDGENGFIVKSNSLPDLINALESLICNKKKLEEMSKNSQSYVMSNLSGGVFYQRFSELINQRFSLGRYN